VQARPAAVIPAKAGIQFDGGNAVAGLLVVARNWIPACAGMTPWN